MTSLVLMLALLLESLVSWRSGALGLALKLSVCWWNGLSAIMLTMAVAAHRSTIWDEHKLGERCDYFIRGSDYSIVCWFVGNVQRHLVVELCLNDSKERLRSGWVQQYGNGCSWSHLRDGT